MASAPSSSSKSSSRFSTFKVFKFAGSSKPPAPPPKDANYLYSANNPSVLSLSNQSVSIDSFSQPPTPASPYQPAYPPPPRCPSPAPSRATQSAMSTSGLTPDGTTGFKKGIMKMASFSRRTFAPKSPRIAPVDQELRDDESISLPWNFQHNVHVDDNYQGMPPTWSASLAEAGFSDEEIAAIQAARRARSPASQYSASQYSRAPTTASRAHSPAPSMVLTNPRPRTSSLRRQRSDASLARSDRSGRSTQYPHPPPPPLPQALRQPSLSSNAPSIARTDTPDFDFERSYSEVDPNDSVTAHSDAQYVYVNVSNHDAGQQTGTSVSTTRLMQPAPGLAPTLASPSARSVYSIRQQQPPPVIGPPPRQPTRTPPRKALRVVNETSPPGGRISPPPAYASPGKSAFEPPARTTSPEDMDAGDAPPLTNADVRRPRPREKSATGSSPIAQRLGPTGDMEAEKELPKLEQQEEQVQESEGEEADEEDDEVDDTMDASVSTSRAPRLSVMPPRLSLRKDTIDDLSDWTESLFSSIPSATDEPPRSGFPFPRPGEGPSEGPPSTATLNRSGSRKLTPRDPELNIMLSAPEPDDALGLRSSPLYNELMGMMQENGRPASHSSGSSTSRPVSGLQPSAYELVVPVPHSPALADSPMIPASPSPGNSPRYSTFSAYLDTPEMGPRRSLRDSDMTLGARSRDSNMTARSRDSNLSNASGSTVTHAAVVRTASVVRRAPVNLVPSPLKSLKGKERVLEESEEEGVELEHEQPVVPEKEGLAVPVSPMDPTARNSTIAERSTSRMSSRSSIRSRSSDGSGGGSAYGFAGSPGQTMSVTSGSNSNEEGDLKSPALAYLHSAQSPSPMETRFPQHEAETAAAAEDAAEDDEESAGRPSIVITTDMAAQHDSPKGVLSPASGTSMTSPIPSPSPSTPGQRYPGWLSQVLKPLSSFIDATVDPRELFEDLQEVGEGESGSVYAARVIKSSATEEKKPFKQPPTPTSPYEGSRLVETVAIKNVPILPTGSPKLVELRRELELMRGLRHANMLIMETLYVDLVEDSLWIRMELMERSLADMLGVGEGEDEVVIGEKVVARFVWDVLLALSYLSKQRIAHRDLRSDNLLLNKDGVVKIADFSNAVHVPLGAPKSAENVGVIYWQAPEMRIGLYDPLKVDVWSLGATAWELVQGEPPFSDVQDTRQIGTQLPPLSQPEIYSRSFHDFLRSCCSPVASRPNPDDLLLTPFIRTASPRSAIVQLLAQCKAIEEKLLQRRLSLDSQGTIS